MTHIFISYSRKDIEYAQHIHQELEKRNYRVWRDEKDIMPGDHWMDGITKAIQDCKLFLVIMSPSSERSEWVKREVLIADRLNKTRIPLLLAGEVFLLLSDVQYEDVTNGRPLSEKFYDTINKHFAKNSSQLSPQQQIELLEERISQLQSLVDDLQKPATLQTNSGISNEITDGIHRRLIDLAKQGKLIEYKQLALEFGLSEDHHARFTIPSVIGNISVIENEMNRPLLSVLVIGKSSGIPGHGFYSLAKYLKPEYRAVDDMTIFATETNAVFQYWQSETSIVEFGTAI
jgi:hypothetical protein